MNLTRKAAVLGCAAAMTVPLVIGGPAAAQPLARERVVYEDHFEHECGGLVFHGMASGSGNIVFVERGRSGLPHFNGTWHETVVFTNPETGLTYTGVFTGSDRDATVTDNGDGTLAIVVQTAGVDKWYDADGKLLYIDSGMSRFELLVDHAGTPSDPFDDGDVTFVGVLRDLTGRTDTFDRDFCADLLEVTG
jgi:hypothetical protein